jgi:hypothetical protein
VIAKAKPSTRPVAQKLYDNMGKEIKTVYDLEYDQEVWVSYGEPFQNPFSEYRSSSTIFFGRAELVLD